MSSRNKDKRGKHRSTADLVEVVPQQIVEPVTTQGGSSRGFDSPRATLPRGESDDYYSSHPAVAGGGYIQSPVDIQSGYRHGGGGLPTTSEGGGGGRGRGYGGGYGYTTAPPPQSHYPTTGAGGGYGGHGAPTGYHPNPSYTHSGPPTHNSYPAYNAPPLQHNASYVAHVYQAPPPHSQNTPSHPSHHGPPLQQSYGGYTHPQQYDGKPPRRDSTSSSSGSSSYVEISRYATLPALKQNPLAAVKTFFTAPSGSKRRAIKKRPSASSLGRRNPKKKHGRRHSSSSSEVDSDLAYGTAFVKRHRLRRRRGSRGSRSPGGRGYGSPRRQGSGSPRRASPWRYRDTGYQPSAHPSHTSKSGAFPADHRELSAQERDQQPRPNLSRRESEKSEKKKKKSADEEIRKIGEDFHKLAKQQNKLHLAEAAKRGSVNPRRDDSGRHGLGPKEIERGLGSSKPVKHAHEKHGKHGHHGDDDSDGWEDDNSSDSDGSSADSALAFGGEDIYPRFRRSPSPRAQAGPKQGGPRRKSTIVDPRLFGPNNSLAGVVTRPVGFEEVDIMGPGGSTPVPPPNVKQTGYFRSPLPSPKPAARGEREAEEIRRTAKKRAELEMQRRDSERNREWDGGRDAELIQVFPMPTDNPHAFDALTSTPRLDQGGMEKRPSFHARTDSLPLRQPKPMSPVRQKVYDGQVSIPELTRSHDHALGGLAGAALAAAIAEEKRACREALTRDEEERRRGEDREIDSMRMFRDDMSRRNGKSPELLRSKPATVMGQNTPIYSAVGDRQGRESRVDPFRYQANDIGDDVFEKKVYAPKPHHERIAARAAESNPDTSRRVSRGGTPTGSCKDKEPAAGYRSIKDYKYYPDSPREKKYGSILPNLAGVAAAAIGGIGIAKMASRAAERGPDTDFRHPADFSTKPEINRSQTFPTPESSSQRAAFLDNEGITEPLTGLGSNLEMGNSIEGGYTPAIVSVGRKPKWARGVSPMPPTRRAYSPPREGSPPPQIADAAPSFARFEGGMPSRLPHEREPSFVSYEDPQPFTQPVDTSSRGEVVGDTKLGHRREALRRFSSDADHRYAAMSSDYFSSREPVRGRSHTRSPLHEIREGRDKVGLRSRSRPESRRRSKSPNVRQARHSGREARQRSYRKHSDEDWRRDGRDHEGRIRDDEGERGRAVDEEKKMYDEVEQFTAPLPAAAISSAVHAVHAQYARRSRDQSPASHRSQDRVQGEADRTYKKTVLARRIAESHSGENSPPRVVTPPAMEHREREKEREKHTNKKGPYSEPDADFVFDHEMHPHEEKIFTPVALRKSWPILAEMESEGRFDPSMVGLNRPLLNIVRPTPEPEKQIKLQMPRSPSQSRERKFETSKKVEAQPKYGVPVLVDDIRDVDEPTSSTSRFVAEPEPLERRVSWGENETQHYDVVTPYPDNPSHNPFTTASAASPPTQSPTDGKRTPPWEQSHPAGKALPSIPPSDDEDHTHAPPSHPDLQTLREVAMATSSASPTPSTRPKPNSLWSKFTPDLAGRIRDQEAAAALLVNASTIGFADRGEGDDVNSPDKVPSRLEELRERESIWAREEEDRERQLDEEERLEREARHAERDTFRKGEAFEYRGIIVEPELSPENSTPGNEEARGRDIELDRHDSGSPPPVGPKPSVMPGGFEDDTDIPVLAYRAVSPPGSDVETVIYHQPFDLSTKAELGTSSASNSRPVSRDQPKIGSDDSFVVVEADPTPQPERDETMVVVVEPEHGKSESFAVVGHPVQGEETQSLLRNAASEGSESPTEDFVMPVETPEGDMVTPFETDRGIDGIGATTDLSTGESAVIVDALVEPSGEIVNEPYDLSREESAVIVDAPPEEVEGDVEIVAPAKEGESTTVIPIVLAPTLESAETRDAADATRDGGHDPKIVPQEVVPDIVDAATKDEAIVIPSNAEESGEVVSTPVETVADPPENSSSGKKLNKKQRRALEKKQTAEAAQAALEAAAISVAAGAGVALIADALKDEPKSEEVTREVIKSVADEIGDAPVEELKGVVDASFEASDIVDAPTTERGKPGLVEAQDEASREVIDAPIEQPPTSDVTDAPKEPKVDEDAEEVSSSPVNDTAAGPYLATSGTENDSSTPAKKLNKKQRKALEKAQAAQREAEREAELAAAAESTIEVDAADSVPAGESDTHNMGEAVAVQNTGPTAESSGAIAEEDRDIIDAPVDNAQRDTEDEPTKIVVEATESQPEEGVNTFEAVQAIHDATAEPAAATEPPLPGPPEAEQAIINEQATAEPMVEGPTSEEQAAINEQATAEPISELVDAPIETASKEVDIPDTSINTPQDSSAEVTVAEEPPKDLNKKQRKVWLKTKKAADEATALEVADAPVDVPAETLVETPAMKVLPTDAIVDTPVQESRNIVEPTMEPQVDAPVVEVLPGDEIVDVPTEEVKHEVLPGDEIVDVPTEGAKHDIQSTDDLTSAPVGTVESSTTKNALPEPSPIVTTADALTATGYTIRRSEPIPTSAGDVLEAEASPTVAEFQAILDAGPPAGLNKKKRKEWEKATKAKIADAEAAAVAQAELDAQTEEDKREQARGLVVDDIIPEVLPTPIYEDESGAFASAPLATPPVEIEAAIDEGEHMPKSRVVSVSMAEAASLAESLKDEKKPQLTRKLSKKETRKLEKEANERQLGGLDEAAGDADGSSTATDTDGGARVSVPVDAFADLASAGDVVDDEWNESDTTSSKKKKKKRKTVELTDEVAPSGPSIETGSEELKVDIPTDESEDIIPVEPSQEEDREIIEQTDDDDAFHSANEIEPNDQATDDGNLTETEFKSPKVVPADTDGSDGHTEPSAEPIAEDAKEPNIEVAAEKDFAPVSGKKKKKKTKRGGSGTGTGTDASPEESAAEQESFLAKADTPGAGVGLVGAIAANALVSQSDEVEASLRSGDENVHQQSNADGSERWSQPLSSSVQGNKVYEDEDDNKTVMGLEDIQERNEGSAGLSEEREMAIDPEIKERKIRPSIDPQFGDLLPLPPSDPGSPHPELGDEGSAIGLPASPPPGSPATTRELNFLESPITPRKRASGSHIPRSPSVSAVPLNFLLRRRGSGSMPSSPITPQVGATSPTRSEVWGLSLESKERKRPTSWDNSREMQPFQLPEFARSHSRSNSVTSLRAMPPLFERADTVEEQAVETGEPESSDAQPIDEDVVVEIAVGTPLGPQTSVESQPIKKVTGKTPLPTSATGTATESSSVESGSSNKSKKKKKKGKQAAMLEPEPILETVLPTEIVSETPVEITADVIGESAGDTPIEATRHVIEHAAVIGVTQDVIDEASTEAPAEITEPVTEASKPAATDGSDGILSAIVEVIVAEEPIQKPAQMTVEIVEPVTNIAHEDLTEECSVEPVVVEDAAADIPTIDRPLETPAEDLSSTGSSTATSSKSKKKKKKDKQVVVPESEPVVETSFPTGSIAETPIDTNTDVVQEPIGEAPVESMRDIAEASIVAEVPQETIAEAFVGGPAEIIEAAGDTIEAPAHGSIVADPTKVEKVPADRCIQGTEIEEPLQAPTGIVQSVVATSEQASAVPAARQEATAEIPMIQTPFPILAEHVTEDLSSTGFSTATSSKSKKKKKKGKKGSITDVIPDPETVAETPYGSLQVDEGLATEGSTPASTFVTAMDERPEYLFPPTDESTQSFEPVMETVISPVEAPVESLSQLLDKENREVLDAPITVPEPNFNPSIPPPTEQEQALINAQTTSEPILEDTGTPLAEPFIGDLKATDTTTKMPAQDTTAEMAEAPVAEPFIREVNITEAPTYTPALAVESQPPTSSDVTESEEPPKGLNKKQRKAWLKAKKAADEVNALEAANTPAEAPVESGSEPPAQVISEAQVVEDVTTSAPLPIAEEAVQDEAPGESSPGLTTAEALRSAGYFIAPISAPVDNTSIADDPATEIPPLWASKTPPAETENATQTVEELQSILDAGPLAGLNKKKRKEWVKAQKAKLAEAEAAAAQVVQVAAEAEIVTTNEPERGLSVEDGACKILPSDMPVEGTGDVAAEPISALEPIAEPSLTDEPTTDVSLPPTPAEIMPESATVDEPVTENVAKEIPLPETPLDTPVEPASEKPSTDFTSTSSKESKMKNKKVKGVAVTPEPETPMAEQSYDAGDDNQPQREAAKNLKLALDIPIQPSEVALTKPVVVDAPIETPAEITEALPEPAQVMAESKSERSLKEATKDVNSETTIPASEIIAPMEAPEGAANEIDPLVEPPTTDDIPVESPPGLATAEAFARAGFDIPAEPISVSKDKGNGLGKTTSETPLWETPIETPAKAAAEDEWVSVKKLNKKERRALEKKQAMEAELAAAEAESAPIDETVVKPPIDAHYSVEKSVTEQPIEPLLPPTSTAPAQVEEVVPEVPLPESNRATPLETPADTATESERAPTRKLGKKEKKALENEQKAELEVAADEPSSAPTEAVESILEQPAAVSGGATEEPLSKAIKTTEQLPVVVEPPFEKEIETDARLSESTSEVPIRISTEDEKPSLEELQIVLDGGPPPGLNKKKRKEWERTQKAKLAEAEVAGALRACSSTPLNEPIEKDVVTDSATIPDPAVESEHREVVGELNKNVTPEAFQDSPIEVAIGTPLPETPVEASAEKLGIPEAASETPIKTTADDERSSTPAKMLNKKQRRALEKQRGKMALEIELAAAAPPEILEEAPTDVVENSPDTEREAETEPPQDVATEALPEAPVETATEIPLPETSLETPAQTSTETVSDSLDDLIGVSRKKSKRKKGKRGAVGEAEPELQLVAEEANRDLAAEVIVPGSSAEEPKIVLDEAPPRTAPVTFDSFRTHLGIEELGRAIATTVPLPSQGATPYETDIDPAVQTPEQGAAPPLPTFDSIRTHLGDEELGRAIGTALPLPSVGAAPYETDNGLAVTIAAGLEASGFDSERVMEGPTFSKQVSPRQSAEHLKVITEDPAISRHISPRASQEQLARDNERPESPLNEDEGVNEPLFSKKAKKKGKGKGKSPIAKKGADGGMGPEGGMETVAPSDVPTSEYDVLPSEPISPSASKKKKANKGKARAASIVDRMPSTTSVVKEPSLSLKDTAIVSGVGAGVAAFASGIALPDSSEAGSSKKCKKKGKIVDMRTGGDNLFDDPALWEGADPKSFEETRHGDAVAIEQKDEGNEGNEGDFMGESPVEKEETRHEGGFASTIAAGLEASGFDAGEVMQDPTFSHHGSPTAESQVVKDPTMATTMLAADDSLDESIPLPEDTAAREDTYATRDFQEWAADAALLQQPISASEAEILEPSIPTAGVLQSSEEVRRKVSDLVEKFEVCNDTLPVGHNEDENLTRQGPDVDHENVGEPLIAAKGSIAPETFQEPELLPVCGKFEDEGPAPRTLDLERPPSPKKDPIDDVKDFFEQKKLSKKDQKALDRRNVLAVDKQKASDEAMRRRYQELEEEVVQSRGGTPVQELRRSEESSRTESSAEGPSVEISAAPIESIDVNIVDRMSLESEGRPVLTRKLSNKEQKKLDKQKRQRELERGKEGDEIVTAGDVVAAKEGEAQVVKAPWVEPELPEAQPSVKPSVTRKLTKKQQKALDKQRRLDLASSALSADDLQKDLGKDKNTDNTTTEAEQELLKDAAEGTSYTFTIHYSQLDLSLSQTLSFLHH